MRSVGSQSKSGREKEGKKEGPSGYGKVMDCGEESFKLVWRCHQLPSGILASGNA
jgi:hypothetical protein